MVFPKGKCTVTVSKPDTWLGLARSSTRVAGGGDSNKRWELEPSSAYQAAVAVKLKHFSEICTFFRGGFHVAPGSKSIAQLWSHYDSSSNVFPLSFCRSEIVPFKSHGDISLVLSFDWKWLNARGTWQLNGLQVGGGRRRVRKETRTVGVCVGEGGGWWRKR